MRHPALEGLCFTPFFIHMMREEITGLPGMDNYIRLGDRASISLAGVVEFKLFVILLQAGNLSNR